MDSVKNYLQSYAALFARQTVGATTETDKTDDNKALADNVGNATGTAVGSQGGVLAAAALGQSWGAYTGGLVGMAGMAGATGASTGAGTAAGLSAPGAYSLGAINAGGMQVEKTDNTIEVAGTGMGADKKYKMYAGELLAVYTVLKGKDSESPQDMAKNLKDKFGIDAEVKTIDGKTTLVNRTTGNVLIADGNGNNIMELSDMKFSEALATIKTKFNIDADQFARMYDKSQGGAGANYGAGLLTTVGGVDAYGRDSSLTHGLWGDRLWQDTIELLFSSSMDYSKIYTPMLGAFDEQPKTA